MRTKSFQLEQTVPGTFFFQGLAGGVLAGLILAMVHVLWAPHPDPNWVIPLTIAYMVICSIVGAVKATLMWGTYRLTGIQLRAPARVSIMTFCIGLIAFLIALKQKNVNERDFAIAVGISFLTALPIALIVGSNVKPWELFTFGSIATGENGNRSGSRSVLATLGTLPLRFASLFALVFWILSHAGEREPQIDDVNRVFYSIPVITGDMAVPFAIPMIYLLFSAYVSFRSPRKIVLLIGGLATNIPLVFIAFYSDMIDAEAHRWGEAFLMAKTAGPAFLIAWGLFLAARLSVRLNKFVRVVPLQDSSHHCLGSRFLEWQERNA